jgi:hypothetical protein
MQPPESPGSRRLRSTPNQKKRAEPIPGDKVILCNCEIQQIGSCFLPPYLLLGVILFFGCFASLIVFWQEGSTDATITWLVIMAVLVLLYVPFWSTRPARLLDPAELQGCDFLSCVGFIQRRDWSSFTCCTFMWAIVFTVIVMSLVLETTIRNARSNGRYYEEPYWILLTLLISFGSFLTVACLLPACFDKWGICKTRAREEYELAEGKQLSADETKVALDCLRLKNFNRSKGNKRNLPSLTRMQTAVDDSDSDDSNSDGGVERV